jgi:hypothetical protein
MVTTAMANGDEDHTIKIEKHQTFGARRRLNSVRFLLAGTVLPRSPLLTGESSTQTSEGGISPV